MLDVRFKPPHFEAVYETSPIYSGIYTFHFEEDGISPALPARLAFANPLFQLAGKSVMTTFLIPLGSNG